MFVLDPVLAADTVFLHKFKLSDLRLMNDSQYPWFILVPRVPDATEIIQLEPEQQQQLLAESKMVSEMLTEAFLAEKLNIAALGNVVSQLHIHHIGRFKQDAAWPKPVWGVHPPEPYTENELSVIKERVEAYLS